MAAKPPVVNITRQLTNKNADGSPQDYAIFNGSREAINNIDRVVMHTTEGSSLQSAMGEWNKQGTVASAHYVIERDGTIYQAVADNNIAYHVRNNNSDTIGFEHVGFAGNTNSISDAQYASSAKLAAYLSVTYNIPVNRSGFLSHAELDPARRSDPGAYFDWTYYFGLVDGAINSGSEGNEDNEGNEGNEGNESEGDEGNEGNEDNEGNEGDEGNEGNENNEGNEDNEGNEGNEGDEGNEGNEGNESNETFSNPFANEGNEGNENNEGVENDEGNEGNENNEGNEDNEGNEGDEGNEGNEANENNEDNEGNEADEGNENNEANEGNEDNEGNENNEGNEGGNNENNEGNESVQAAGSLTSSGGGFEPVHFGGDGGELEQIVEISLIEGTAESERLEGTAENDLILAGDGADRIYGGLGDDTIDAGAGNDWRVYGGSGADVFEFGTGYEVVMVMDFQDGQDTIRISEGLEYTDLTIVESEKHGVVNVYTPLGDRLVLVVDDDVEIDPDDFSFG